MPTGAADRVLLSVCLALMSAGLRLIRLAQHISPKE